MSTCPFVGGWTIQNWTPSESSGVTKGIPTNGFHMGAPLEISPESSQGSDTFRLDWLNQGGEPCQAPGLQCFQTTLEGVNLPVSFGVEVVMCNLSLTLIQPTDPTDPKELSCQIDIAMPDGGAPTTGGGTFTATANAGGDDAARKR